MEILKF